MSLYNYQNPQPAAMQLDMATVTGQFNRALMLNLGQLEGRIGEVKLTAPSPTTSAQHLACEIGASVRQAIGLLTVTVTTTEATHFSLPSATVKATFYFYEHGKRPRTNVATKYIGEQVNRAPSQGKVDEFCSVLKSLIARTANQDFPN